MRRVSLLRNLDWITVLVYLLLVFVGWINIYAAVYNEDHQNILDLTQKYGKQLMWIIAAFVLAIMILIVDGKFYSTFSYPLYFIMIFLLVTVLIFGREVNGARSWFQLGVIRFQPAEFAKFATCLAIARYLGAYGLGVKKIKTFLISGIFLLVPAFLIVLQRDAGSALVYSVFLFVLYREGLSGWFLVLALMSAVLFVVTLVLTKMNLLIIILFITFMILLMQGYSMLKMLYSVLILAAVYIVFYMINSQVDVFAENSDVLLLSVFCFGIFSLVYTYVKRMNKAFVVVLFTICSLFFSMSVGIVFNNVLERHQRDRINLLVGLIDDPRGVGYNVNQSKIAIGSGGLSGKGFLNGTQTKFNFVPEQSTDFIFCTVGEEHGFLGTSFVLSLFLFLILRLVFLAERQRSRFSRIYGYGVASILFFHVAINVGMAIGLAPVIGIPLPFFSYGGSSLWSFTILLFIFLRLDVNRLELLG